MKFVIDTDTLIAYLTKCSPKITNLIDTLQNYKNCFLVPSSLPKVISKVEQLKSKRGTLIDELSKFSVWKVPSYIDWSHPLVNIDIDLYLVYLAAKSLDAYIITSNENLLKHTSRAIKVEEALNILENSKKDTQVPFLNLPSQNLSLYSKIEKKLDSIFVNSQFVCNKYVKEFEKQFSGYLKAKHCIGVNSGTSALMVALLAIGLKPKDEVIMPVNTFIATAEAVSILGGNPVFLDIHPDYYTIDVEQIEGKITERTKAIIPVHLYGQCADMDPIMKIARKYNLWVIEDACQAHGAEYKGRKAGTIGHIGCFSFYPGKNLGSWGEAGACVTNNEKLAERMYKIRNHGGVRKYQHDILGGNFRMEEIQGAVLSEKLKHIDEWNKKRRKVAELYRKHLKDLEDKGVIKLPCEAPYNKHVYHLFVVQVKDRKNLLEVLKSHKVETGIHYPRPLHLVEVYKDKNLKKFPYAKDVSDKIVSLPIYEFLVESKISYIREVIESYYHNSQ